MRIIAGKYKSIPLKALKGINTRPTSDRVKESLFSIIDSNIKDSVVLDLFGGTGAIGLEMLSRGASCVIINDKSYAAYKVIVENSKKLGCSPILYNMDYKQVLDKLALTNKKIDIVYLDPPYNIGLGKESIKMLLEKNILNKDYIIIHEHSKVESPLDFKELNLIDKRVYGEIAISFYKSIANN